MKDYLKTTLGIFLFVAVIAGAIFLLNNIHRQPSVVLASTVCDPPCWNGITPGLTHSSQALAILEDLEGVQADAIMADYDRDDTLLDLYWIYQRPVADGMGTIYFEADRVIAIKISTVNSLDLAHLFERTGNPEIYWTEIGQREDHGEYLLVSLFQPARGVQADVVIEINGAASQVEITPSSPVFSVTYFAPENFQALLQTRLLIDQALSARGGEFMPWSGYGAIPFERK